jgi:hypothetical protein
MHIALCFRPADLIRALANHSEAAGD